MSFFVPGVGQFVFNDQSKRGAIVFVAAVLADIIVFVLGSILGVLTLGLGLLLYLLMPVIHAGAAYDAYNQAEKINAGEIQP